MPHSSLVVVIRGGSGTGKSSLALSLRSSFRRGVTIESDRIREMQNAVDWMNKDNYRDCLSLVATTAEYFIRRRVTPITVVDKFAADALHYFRSLLPHSTTLAVISLYADERTIRDRMRIREGDRLAPDAVANSLEQNREERVISGLSLDTSTMTLAEVHSATVHFITTHFEDRSDS